jgi:hypothetical protein
VFLGKSVGILFSPLLEQSTTYEPAVQLHTLGHDDATPTSRITATIAVIGKNTLDHLVRFETFIRNTFAILVLNNNHIIYFFSVIFFFPFYS